MNAEEAATLTFDQLATHFSGFLNHVSHTYYVPSMSPDDVAQEAQIVLWRCHQTAQRGMRLTHSFDSYVRRAIINRLTDLQRHANRQPKQTSLEDASIVPSDDSRRAFDNAETQVQLDIASLSDDAKLLVSYVLADRRDYRDAFIRQVGSTRYRAVQRYNAAKQEIVKALGRRIA